jgi:hypothetical protein
MAALSSPASNRSDDCKWAHSLGRSRRKRRAWNVLPPDGEVDAAFGLVAALCHVRATRSKLKVLRDLDLRVLRQRASEVVSPKRGLNALI